MNWTFPLFRIFGIKVRMHWAMAIFVLFYLIQGLDTGRAYGLGIMAATMSILLVSILIHELAHCWMAIRLGGSAEDIMLWPLGGLSTVSHSNSPGVEIKVAGIGPISSFVLSGACYGALHLLGGLWQWRLLFPFDNWGMDYPSLAMILLLHAARLNLYLGLFNLLVPAYPLDGGRVLFAFLTVRVGRQRAAGICASLAMPIGILMAAWGLAKKEFTLGFLGIWVFIQAWQLFQLLKMGELDSHPGFGGAAEFEYMPDRPRKKGWLSRWRESRARKAAVRESEKASEQREKVDAILEKVSREGIGSLSAAEKKILDDASRRGRGG
jgi:Zn-dependent protease